MHRQILEPEQKALEINLDPSIYGTFAEIGAGQEVARYFFKVGAAAGTIAKTMSAYDKIFSDKIYGVEESGRYVCEKRLYKMLDHEYDLMESRLQTERPDTNFFVFADTVAAINYTRTIKGNGWLGLRFQLHPNSEPNDIILHARMLDNDNTLQQQAIGILGVNLIYACYRYHENPEMMVTSLIDSLRDRIKIDMVRITGPDFKDLDNRLLSLWLVKNKMTDVSMFGEHRQTVHASEFLYKKHVLVVRGSFRPATLVNWDMMSKSYEQFRKEPEVDSKRAKLLTEITLDNLMTDGTIDEQDFLDRAEVLSALGQTVVVSNCTNHQGLITYLMEYKIRKLGLVIGARELLELMNNKYYENLDGKLLAAFGQLFTQHVKLYTYPALQEGSAELMSAKNLPIPDGITFLYKHLLDCMQIVDVEGVDADLLHVFSKDVLKMIQEGDKSWVELVPKNVAKVITSQYLFNHPVEQETFEY